MFSGGKAHDLRSFLHPGMRKARSACAPIRPGGATGIVVRSLILSIPWMGLAHAKNSAVSSVNGKVEGIGADVDRDGVQLGGTSLSVPLTPLSKHLGLQLDGATGEFASTDVNGYGFQLFWRDPNIGLAGVTAARIGFGSTWGHRVGLEAESYLDRFTLSLMAGLQRGELLNTGYANVDIRAYVTDDLALEAGGGLYSDERTGHVGVEWQPLTFGLGTFSLFADVGFGNHGYDHTMGGVRLTFGGSGMTLKDRQRGG